MDLVRRDDEGFIREDMGGQDQRCLWFSSVTCQRTCGDLKIQGSVGSGVGASGLGHWSYLLDVLPEPALMLFAGLYLSWRD